MSIFDRLRQGLSRTTQQIVRRFDEIVTQCKVGARSAKAADFLRSVGFKRVLNLKGGILEWIDRVDPTQPKY